MSGAGGMSDRRSQADARVSAPRTVCDPYRRPDLAGWWCRRAAIIGKLLPLVLGDRSRQGFRDIAFPAIATGIYGFPRREAAEIAVTTVISHLARHESPELVIFVCFDPATLEAYRKALGKEA
jgi:O-acetyl-ADP-ribose deacetylase